ncbi:MULTISPECIES: fluoride efflux transporter CrcB [Alteromonadaceae]|uniref:Fluoride-specific ion channel FluC n=1 Tax=Brumicola blandensis TaxID=3075611 RepID=A0AAW8QZM1_9ALTE|nr:MULTISPECIES: fluoride efflux transporter CrcB [unclassified Alteromonas]MDT0581423.1 fluoride efflux transporter CrcB [Alteromonas sp. W409]MDT0627051.1 fluoride efflux transporter CrcB [Alteromonas sp. W364]
MSQIQIYLFVAVGGALGACLRYFVTQIALNLLGKGFPFATLAVNVVGSFFLGLVYSYIQGSTNDTEGLRALVMVGILGAFTTFSTFSLETILLIQQGDILKAGLNLLLNVVVCLLAVWAALLLFKG